MADEIPGPNGMVIFLHIPKTGGRTLATMLRKQYGASKVYEAYSSPPDLRIEEFRNLPAEQKQQYRAIAGHVDMHMHLMVPGPSVYITLLRHPLRRVVSEYHYIRRRAHHRLHPALSDPAMTLDRAVQSGLVRMFDNGQTRALAGMDPDYGCCDRSMLDAAIHTVDERIAVAGIVERFDESVLLMKRILHWRSPFYQRYNVAPEPRKDIDLPPSAAALIRDLNRLDFELYEHVSRKLTTMTSGAAFRRQALVFELLNGIRNRGRRLAAHL